MIDWTLPVETTEDPPRPVRVLATDLPCTCPVVVMIYGNKGPSNVRVDGRVDVNCGKPYFRNVTPTKPEPVLIEGWINFVKAYTAYEGGTYWVVRNGAVWTTKERALIEAKKMSDVICTAHICVMSDGSPVPSEASGEDAPDGYISRKAAERRELDALRDRDRWKAKAEEALALLRKANDQSEALLAAARAALEQIKSVA